MCGLWWFSWAKYIRTTIESKACGVYKNLMFGELKTVDSLDFYKKGVIDNKMLILGLKRISTQLFEDSPF